MLLKLAFANRSEQSLIGELHDQKIEPGNEGGYRTFSQ
jgi:hypothetical protein